jgi:demethylmenaquinone methyltransferase/2-methoxy-6-polyprenyl-1,4-benzoquinol methylase
MKESPRPVSDLPDPQAPDPKQVRRMFDRLADGYDAFNAWASLGLDRRWRKALLEELRAGNPRTILDLGTGTGDLIAGSSFGGFWMGLDLSLPMLRKASAKCGPERSAFFQAGAAAIPVASGSVDAVVSAFVLRNVKKILPEVLSEILRILKPGGRALLLEMYAPDHAALNALHRIYLKTALPAAGRLAFGSRWSGEYLPETILQFGSPRDFSGRLEASGFREISFRTLSGGIAALHSAKK